MIDTRIESWRVFNYISLEYERFDNYSCNEIILLSQSERTADTEESSSPLFINKLLLYIYIYIYKIVKNNIFFLLSSRFNLSLYIIIDAEKISSFKT